MTGDGIQWAVAAGELGWVQISWETWKRKDTFFLLDEDITGLYL